MGQAPGIDPVEVKRLAKRESARYVSERPRTMQLLERGRASMPRGVPMAWMANTYGHDAMVVAGGSGLRFTDVDGHEYVDFNLSDTSTFCGFSPEPVVEAVRARVASGVQFMLPSEDAVVVAEELGRRWGLPRWQFTLSATQANTEAFRVARFATGRDVLVFFEGKYHGHGDEMLVVREGGEVVPEFLGLPSDVTRHVRLVAWNDVDALARALAPGDVACVVMEPAQTNCGVLMPAERFHEEVRALTRATGTLLVMDETHTLICGPGGLVRRWGLEPDIVTMGKSIGAGVPIGAYGMTEPVARAFENVSGVYEVGEAMDELATGGTLFGNHLQMAAARAALTRVLTDEVYARTGALGARLADGIEDVAAAAGLPWKAHRLFARSGYMLDGRLPRNAEEFHHAHDGELMRLMRVFMANRGVWEAIVFAGPAVGVPAVQADVDRYLEVLAELVAELTG